MQTFLPYSSFVASAATLDGPRLGKQRVETMQLFTAITGLAFPNKREIAAGKVEGRIFNRGADRAWQNHPAARMWRGHVLSLVEYQRATCAEWARRGYADTCLAKTEALAEEHLRREAGWGREVNAFDPPWLGDPRVHDSHKANLVRKNADVYGKLWPEIEPLEGYFWPVP